MKDQLHRTVKLDAKPKRIVSLVPSQTELLYDLGLRDEVVGITKFCIHPEEWFRNKTRIGGTKNVHIEKVIDLQPDLILANKEENTLRDILALEQICPIWISDIRSFNDALNMIQQVGIICKRERSASAMVEKLRSLQMRARSLTHQRKKALYLIWKDPYMAAGCDTFIHEMMTLAGFENIIINSRYPMVQSSELSTLAPEVILLSSEPYPFKQHHIEELQGICPKAKIVLVDGELFSWYGSRMLASFDYFSTLHEQIQ